MKRAHLYRFIAIMLVLTLVSLPFPAMAAEEVTVRNNLDREGVGIRVCMSSTLDDPMNAFSVVGPEGELTISSVTADGKIYTIETQEKIDLRNAYTLIFNDVEYAINLTSYYSTEES